MYFCPNCKKKFRDKRRRCPICNGPCYRRDNSTFPLLILITVLLILLVGLIIFLAVWSGSGNDGGETTSSSDIFSSIPDSSSGDPTNPSSTGSTPTTVPTPSTSTPDTSVPPVTGPGEYIGNLYTREQLEKMDSVSKGYGVGKEVDGKNRPTYAISMNKKYEKYDAHFICPDDGKVYLTYNVTYEHEGLVQKTLDILQNKQVQCVFFIDKAFAQNYPDMVRQIINDGHILANHCTTHPDLPTLSIDKIVNQIMDVHNYVKETYGYEMKLFRPPSGYFSEQVWAIAQSLGYRSYNWSFTYLDWDTDNQPNPQATLNKMTSALHSGAIYQFHAISATNAAVLEDFIDTTRAKGYEFALLP